MFFSIVIPVYNRPQEIDELLHSLTQQRCKDFEVLVVEDGSKTDAREIVAAYQSQLQLRYFYKENEGQGFARNFGFSQAKGDYFIMFDSDCLIPPDYLEHVKAYLNEHQLDVFGGPDAAHTSFTPVQKAISYAMTSVFTTGGIRGNKKHIGQFHPRGFNMGFSRAVWEQTGGFQSPNFGEDIEFSLRAIAAGFKVGLIPLAVVYHKRRTDFKQFFRQVFSFGRTRINLYLQFPDELKAVHFFPAMFSLFLLFTLIANLINIPQASLCNFLLAVYVLLIFFHSWAKNSSAKVAFLSIIAVFVQLNAYGLGFMQDFWKRLILKQDRSNG